MDHSDDLEEAIFTNARQITDSTARERYIQDACGTDSLLENRVSSLLRMYAEEKSFLESPIETTTAMDLAFGLAESTGSVVGPYELIEQIGAGGMGLVFLAQQHSPVRRQVALKIIRTGMDSRAVVQRFEAERQTLAQLNHPGITRLLDAGTSSTGRPWFVMELAQGLPITDFCRQKSLPLSERLSLFESVCDAVHHAHQNGVIHRDLKPANIVVTVVDDRHVPKVIDFGVARVTQQEAGSDSGSTILNHLEPFILGTPAYMSPEQTYLSDRDLDARCDVYSLGILLYQLLTDARPFPDIQWQDIDYAETRRVIQELSPLLPSERIQSLLEAKGSVSSSVAPPEIGQINDQARLSTQLKLQRLSSVLKGDLDWITMKAIEKNRDQRYASVADLAADIRRHVNHEPVQAGPAAPLYRLKKLLRRRKSRVAVLSLAGGLVLLLSLSVLIGRSLLVERAESAKNRQLVQDQQQLVVARDDLIRQQSYATDMQSGIAAYFRGDTKRAREKVRLFAEHTDSESCVGFEWHYLNRLCRDVPQVLTGDKGKVFDVAFSPDSRLLASGTGGDAFTLHIWEANSGALLRAIRQFDNDVNGICFNSDGTTVLAAEESGRIRAWDTQSGNLKSQLEIFDSPVSQIFLASNDRTLMASEVNWLSMASKISICDLQSLTRIKQIDGQCILDVNESQRIVATVSNDGVVGFRVFPDLHVLSTFSELRPGLASACLSHDGRILATGSKHGDVRIWRRDAVGSQVLAEPGPGPFPTAIRGVAFSADDKHLIVARYDGIVQILNIANGTIQRVFNPEFGEVWTVCVSPDGKTFATGYSDGHVEMRDWANHSSLRKTVYSSPEPFLAVAHDADGGRMAIVNFDGTSIVVYSTSRGRVLQTLTAPQGVHFRNVAFSADGQALWITDAVGSLFKGNLKDAELVQQPPLFQRPLMAPIVSADGRFLAFNTDDSEDGLAGIRDVQSGAELYRLPGKVHKDAFWSHRITGFLDDSTVATTQYPFAMHWNFRTGQELPPRFVQQLQRIFHTGLSPDRKTMLISLADTNVHLWNLATHETTAVLQGHREVVTASAFSASGRTLATATASGEIRLWHIPTAQSICELQGIHGQILSLWFTADERRLFVAVQLKSGERQIQVWDTSGP